MIKDRMGRELRVGDVVARAVTRGRGADLKVQRVTRIEDGKVYLDNSKVALNYPGRIVILTDQV